MNFNIKKNNILINFIIFEKAIFLSNFQLIIFQMNLKYQLYIKKRSKIFIKFFYYIHKSVYSFFPSKLLLKN